MSRTLVLVKFISLVLVVWSTSVVLQAQPGRDSRATTQPAGRINGRVRLPGGQPAAEILVSCDAWSGGMVGQVRTDGGGRFHIDSLGPAQFTVSIRQPGFLPYSETVELQTTSMADLQITLKPDPNAPAGLASVISAVPPPAQKEYELAEAALAKGTAAKGKKEDIAEAVRHYEQSLTLYPQFLNAQLKMGTAYMELGEWDKAEEALKKTIAMDAKAANAYFALGEVYLRQKKDEEAEKVLVQGLQIEDRSANGHFALTRAYYSMATKIKDDAQARPHLEKAYEQIKKTIELDPNLALAHLMKGNIYFRVRRAADAQHEYEEYLRLDPKGSFADQTRTRVEQIKKALESQPKQ
jgi:Tfp pilus assembly protein PilF